jgi:O-antigen ligase
VSGPQLGLAISVFLACAVEAVEALTIVLAVGITRSWRWALTGVAAATAALAVIVAATALVQGRLSGRDPHGDLKLPRHAPLIALVVICLGLGVAIVAGAHEKAAQTLGAGAARLETLQSNRYAYWRVAVKAFEAQPLRGVGAGGWSVWWLQHRPFDEGAQDAHSLPLQTGAELGVVGLALLAVFLAGVGAAAAGALRVAPALAAGPVAAFVTYVAHSPLDWDWQMPAVTLVAVVLAGLLVALSEGPPGVAAGAPALERDRRIGEGATSRAQAHASGEARVGG